MRWKLKGNWNGADDKSLHTHSFSFELNHFWPLKVASYEENWEKGPYLKNPLFQIYLLRFLESSFIFG